MGCNDDWFKHAHVRLGLRLISVLVLLDELGWSASTQWISLALVYSGKMHLDTAFTHIRAEMTVSTETHATWWLGSINRDIFAHVDVCVTVCDVVSWSLSRCQRGPYKLLQTPGMWNTWSHWSASPSRSDLVFFFLFLAYLKNESMQLSDDDPCVAVSVCVRSSRG